MKKSFTLCLLFLLSGMLNLTAQTTIPAYQVNSDALIVIAANEMPVKFDLYVAKMNFKSAEVMQQYCEAISSFIVKFTADFDQNLIHAQTFPDKIPNGEKWGVKEWNDFFLTYQPKWVTYFSKINQ